MTMSNKEKANAPAKYARRAGEWSSNPTLTRRRWGNVQHVKQARATRGERVDAPWRPGPDSMAAAQAARCVRKYAINALPTSHQPGGNEITQRRRWWRRRRTRIGNGCIHTLLSFET